LTARALHDALAEADAALARADAPAAAAAVQEAVRACQALAAAGGRPAPGELSAALDLHGRLAARASAARDQLAVELERAGRSRRAAAAYRAP
jgi:hypothetical protein